MATQESAAKAGGSQPWRRPAPAGRVIMVMAVCLIVWTLLDAANIQKAAQASPPGTRRTVSLDVIGPLAVVSRYSGFAEVDHLVDAFLGRRPGLLPRADGSLHEILRARARLRAIDDGLVSLGVFGQWPRAAGTAVIDVGRQSTRADQIVQPTATSPLRVLIIGDSIGEDMGQSLSNQLYAAGIVTVELDGHSSTGLARPDYFDWPAEVRSDVAVFKPQVTVAMFGGNDGQGFVQNGQVFSFGTPPWSQAYSARVDQVISMLTSGGGSVFWVGMPPMADQGLNSEMGILNAIYEARAAGHPRTHYISTTGVLGGTGGTYAAFLPDQSGQLQQVRSGDGVHLTTEGGNFVGNEVISAMEKVLGITLPAGG